MIDEETNDPLHLGGDPESLLKAMKTLEDELGDFRPLVLRANRTARRSKIVAIIAVFVGSVGIIIGIGGWRAQVAANEARDAARISTCVQENVRIQTFRDALVAGLLAVLPNPEALTPEQQVFVDAYSEAVDQILKLRDCTPAGIREYIENPPSDPALDL